MMQLKNVSSQLREHTSDRSDEPRQRRRALHEKQRRLDQLEFRYDRLAIRVDHDVRPGVEQVVPGIAADAGQSPLDDPPLDRNERMELQERLARQGFDTGPVDGVVGESTRAAIRTWQSRYGLAPDGWAGRRLLGLLRLVGPVAR